MNIKQNIIFRGIGKYKYHTTSKIALAGYCRRQFSWLWLVFLFCICAAPGCGSLKLESSRRDREIIIDGKYSDWGKTEAYYDEKDKLVINLCNDQDYLYICFISRNRKVETQLIESGFVAWFDPDRGKNKSFGIRFPIGMKSMGMSITENEKKSREYRGEGDIEDHAGRESNRWIDKDFAKKLETLAGLQEKMEIIRMLSSSAGPSPKMELSLEEAAKLGIEAKMGHENGYFVYELKVPLIKSLEHPYAVELRTDKTIGLGFEVQKSMMIEKGMGGSPNFQLWATVVLS